MKVLIVGSGGREHALAWVCGRSAHVDRVFVAPGNAGTLNEDKCTNVEIAVSDFQALISLAQEENIDLTIIGPEDPLVNGIREQFDDAGLKCFAPSKEAAQLEGSKAYAKSFMQRHGIPTASFMVTGEIEEAERHINQSNLPVVVKAVGLAAGKGVVVAQTKSEAINAATQMLSGGRFGEAGCEIVIEDFLVGEEASYIVMSDGVNYLPFASSQDHKPVFDGNQGPNTGGMGAYSPSPVVTDEVDERIKKEVIEPTINGMASEGHPFQGFLYAGLMVGADKSVSVVEFNCRFGDPEAQPVLYRLRSDLPSLCLSALNDGLQGKTLEFEETPSVGVVMASGGYPESYETGFAIEGLDKVPEGCKVFHAGTKSSNSQFQTSGGRVLCVIGSDREFRRARELAYAGVHSISWPRCHFRTDIGASALSRLDQH